MTQQINKTHKQGARHASIVEAGASVPKELLGAVVALGNFDGVHRGHQAVIRQAVAMAKASGVPAALMTFEPHPQTVFSGKEPSAFRLSDSQAKIRLAESMGAGYLFEVPFDKALFTLDAVEFVKQVLLSKFQVSGVVCGYDFAFGHKRVGNVALLETLSKQYGFAFASVDAVSEGAEAYSSSSIRKALKEGEIKKANHMLGHYHLLHGAVLHGDKRGRTIGFPTANIMLENVMAPAYGVYTGLVTIEKDDAIYPAVMNFGTRPTFDKKQTLLEVHLLDQKDHDLYGKELWVELVDYLRPEKKFENIEALKKQIIKDAEKATAQLKELVP